MRRRHPPAFPASADIMKPATPMSEPAAEEMLRDALLAYVDTDLLCYRAASPPELAERQRESWGAVLDWAARRYGCRFDVTQGVIPIRQPSGTHAALAHALGEVDALALEPLLAAVRLLGSLILGLAVAEEHLAAEEAWRLSRLDEAFQAERWGEDEEAAACGEALRREFEAAARVLSLAPKARRP